MKLLSVLLAVTLLVGSAIPAVMAADKTDPADPPKVETTPESEPESKPESKPESEPESKPESKPDTTPEAPKDEPKEEVSATPVVLAAPQARVTSGKLAAPTHDGVNGTITKIEGTDGVYAITGTEAAGIIGIKLDQTKLTDAFLGTAGLSATNSAFTVTRSTDGGVPKTLRSFDCIDFDAANDQVQWLEYGTNVGAVTGAVARPVGSVFKYSTEQGGDDALITYIQNNHEYDFTFTSANGNQEYTMKLIVGTKPVPPTVAEVTTYAGLINEVVNGTGDIKITANLTASGTNATQAPNSTEFVIQVGRPINITCTPGVSVDFGFMFLKAAAGSSVTGLTFNLSDAAKAKYPSSAYYTAIDARDGAFTAANNTINMTFAGTQDMRTHGIISSSALIATGNTINIAPTGSATGIFNYGIVTGPTKTSENVSITGNTFTGVKGDHTDIGVMPGTGVDESKISIGGNTYSTTKSNITYFGTSDASTGTNNFGSAKSVFIDSTDPLAVWAKSFVTAGQSVAILDALTATKVERHSSTEHLYRTGDPSMSDLVGDVGWSSIVGAPPVASITNTPKVETPEGTQHSGGNWYAPFTSKLSASTADITCTLPNGKVINQTEDKTLFAALETVNGKNYTTAGKDIGDGRNLGMSVQIPQDKGITKVSAEIKIGDLAERVATLYAASGDSNTAGVGSALTPDGNGVAALNTNNHMVMYPLIAEKTAANAWTVGGPTKYVWTYTYYNASDEIVGTQVVNVNITYAAAPPVKAKPIGISTTVKDGQQADQNAELKGTFGFATTETANSIIVKGSSTDDKLVKSNPDATFVTYYQVPGLKVDDVENIRISRNGTVLATEALDSGANAPQDLGTAQHLHFKLGTVFATKTGNDWVMKYKAPYTEKVELINKYGSVVASTTYTVDFTNATVIKDSADVVIDPPTIDVGIVQGDIPELVIIPDETTTLNGIKANTGILDDKGNKVITTDTTKVTLNVDGISTASTDAAVVADKAKINATAEASKAGAKSAFLDITLSVVTPTGTDGALVTNKISDLGTGAVEVIVSIPTNLLAVTNATYSIMTVHDGKLSTVPSTKVGTASLKFNAKQFSTYAIVATPQTTPPPQPPIDPIYPSNPTPPTSGGGSYGGSGGGGGSYYDSRPTYNSPKTITDKTAHGVAITFPIGIRSLTDPSFTMSEITSVEDEFKVFKALAQGYNVLSVFDINLYDGSTKVRNVDGGNLVVSLPYPQGKAGVSYKVLRNNEDGTITELPAIFSNGIITFETNHFSKFAVAVTSGTVIPNDQPGTGTTTPTPIPAPSENPPTGDNWFANLLSFLFN